MGIDLDIDSLWIAFYRLRRVINKDYEWQKEFGVSDEVVWIIAFESIIWSTMMYYPFIVVVHPIILYIHFKFIVFKIKKWQR